MRLTIIHLLLLVCFFASSFQAVFGQKNYQPGIIVTNDSDTVVGYIDYQQWERNPSSINFKTIIATKQKNYFPDDLVSFEVSDDIYISREIEVTKSPRKTDNISYDVEYPTETKQAFVLVLVSGSGSLYKYVDEMGTDHYYIETQEQPLLELIYFKYYKKINGTRVIKENTKYKGQLIAYLNDCPSIIDKINKTIYKSEALKKMVIKYNQCKNINDIYVKEKEKTKYRFGIFTGITFSTINFNTEAETFKYLWDANYNNSLWPTAGILVILEPARGRGKWTVYFDLHVKNQYHNTKYTDYKHENQYTNYDINVGTTSLKFTAIGRYNFVGSKITPYLGAGMHFSYTLAYQNQKNYEKILYESVVIDSEPIFYNGVPDFDLGFAFSAGAKYRKFCLDLRFDLSAFTQYSINPAYTMAGSSKSFYLTIGYLFN